MTTQMPGKVVSFFLETKQSFECEGQTQVEMLMTHPVYPAAVGCDRTVLPAVEARTGTCSVDIKAQIKKKGVQWYLFFHQNIYIHLLIQTVTI